MTSFNDTVANAIIGIDTIWGGDVLNPSGTGRFIADSWFSDQPLPLAYTHATAAAVRETGGVSAKQPNHDAIDRYVEAVKLTQTLSDFKMQAADQQGRRGVYLTGLAECLDVMWDLALEILGRRDPVSYERCVIASTGSRPGPSDPASKRELLLRRLTESGYPVSLQDGLLDAVDTWRSERVVPSASIPALAAAFIAEFNALTTRNLMPYLPSGLAGVPRSNIRFMPIRDAWFSGSMNYLGRARTADGKPEFEATYEINSSLQISVPEFQQLISHEVEPGHVTTFAFLQALYEEGQIGFEGTVQTMNTRAAALSEGIANNAILIAHGVNEIEELPDRDLQIGVLLALLQDDAKNQSSYLTWKEGWPQERVAATLRNEFLVSKERADKLSGAWGRHPLLGRMYLPAYRAGTELVAELRRNHAPKDVLPALYGCTGLEDVVTIGQAVG
ncbi:MAG: hypothetical protein EHM23_35755 [Acidobacteria bacterium]|nr:MAG: hypothetical protein EHM23_35755 [Acidobacteriota bacterium]